MQTHIKEGQRYKIARIEHICDGTGTKTYIVFREEYYTCTKPCFVYRISTKSFAVEVQEDKPQQQQPTTQPEEEGDCYIRSVLKAECNMVFYWAFVQHACLTAANHRISLVRKQTRQLQQLTEDSEDAQERLFSQDREYLPIIDGLVTDVLRIPEFIQRVGIYQSVFEDVATRISGATNAQTIAAALVAYCFGREILPDLPPLTRDPKLERQMQATLCDLIQKASGQPISTFINQSVEDATKRLLAILGDY